MSMAIETKTEQCVKTKTSLKQTQQLVLATFSCIGYLRELFPEDAFEEKKMGEMSLKKIKRGVRKETDVFVDWIEKGCFDALSKGYLKTMTLEIYSEDEKTLLEIYEFNIKYNGAADKENIELNLTSGEKVITKVVSEEEFRSTAVKMLRSICLLTQTLDPLPEKKYLSVKLRYYDTVKEDYEPVGFRPAKNEERFQAEEGESVFKHSFGVLNHTNHTIAFGMSAQKDFETQRENAEIAKKIAESQKNMEDYGTVQNQERVIQKEESKTLSETLVVEESGKIICPCGVDEDDSDMIQCEECRTWQHTVCAGFYSNKDKRIEEAEYVCNICKYKDNRKVFKMIHDICCFRRVLSILYNEGVQSIKWLSARIGFPYIQTQKFVDRALLEGFLFKEINKDQETQLNSDDENNPSVLYHVSKTTEIRERVKRYFSVDLDSLTESDSMSNSQKSKSNKRKLSVANENIKC
eukprot:GHVP01021660.1.p1 GENE.GHVP01021660.1~~GHVP01021660.1.p1  ORF type:complete len:465 (+),score=80.48 GHVP01021660.1:1084-2478(+)